jgi:glycosyltransferase involved in cell wall biosynthesis
VDLFSNKLNLLIFILFSLSITYALFTLVLWLVWVFKPNFQPPKNIQTSHSIQVSVIVPVRNEAKNILALLQDLNTQTLDYEAFEVLVVNDNSIDETPQIVAQFMAQAQYSLKLLHLPAQPSNSPKKQAISLAIAQSLGELIVSTDGDCRVQKAWLATIYHFYRAKQAKLISSAVTFSQEQTIFEKMQTVEFASLVASGASTLSLGFATMSNGANLAYSKAVFAEVKGFEGLEQVASGDDEFLLHKIAQIYPKEVYFLKNPETTVFTSAKASLGEFYQQRKRWGSKWKHYQNKKIKILAMFIFLVNLGVLINWGACLSGFLDFRVASLILLIKWLPEGLYLASFLSYLGKKRFVFWIPIVQLLYSFYVVLFGLVAQGKSYEWKGRNLQ